MEKFLAFNPRKYTALRILLGTLVMATAIAILQENYRTDKYDSFSFLCLTGVTFTQYLLRVFGLIMFCSALPLLSNSYVRSVNVVMIGVLSSYILLSLFIPDLITLLSGILLFLLNGWLKLLQVRAENPTPGGI